MKTDEPALVDSNILIYAYASEDTKKKKKCTGILNRCWHGEEPLAVSVQNLSEFYWVSTKKVKLAPNEIKEIISDIITFGYFVKLSIKPATVTRAIEICEKYKVAYWDSLIVATMLENNVRKIYTENTKEFLRIPEISAVNPLK